jgi:hypothetical protein
MRGRSNPAWARFRFPRADPDRAGREHAQWLETQPHLIDSVALQNYLTEKYGSE